MEVEPPVSFEKKRYVYAKLSVLVMQDAVCLCVYPNSELSSKFQNAFLGLLLLALAFAFKLSL